MSVEDICHKELKKRFNCAPITPPLCAKTIGYFLYENDIKPNIPVNISKEFVDILDDDVQSDIQRFFETGIKTLPTGPLIQEISEEVNKKVGIYNSIVNFLKKLGINIGTKTSIEIEKVRKVSVALSDYSYRWLDVTDIERYAYSRKFKIHPPQKEKYEGKRISLIYGELVMHECNIVFYDKVGAKINVSDIINVDPKYIKDGKLSIKAMENCKDGITIGIYTTNLIGKDGFFVDDEEIRRGKDSVDYETGIGILSNIEYEPIRRGISLRNDLIPYMSKMNMLVINLEQGE